MHPVHDTDALLLLATALAAKRKPAELAAIVAAADLLLGAIPADAKLADAFERLSRAGLIVATADGFALTAVAQRLVADLPRRAEPDQRLYALREALAAYTPRCDHPSIRPTAALLATAIAAHQVATTAGTQNLLVPKPKPEGDKQRPGQRQRKPLPARRRKA